MKSDFLREAEPRLRRSWSLSGLSSIERLQWISLGDEQGVARVSTTSGCVLAVKLFVQKRFGLSPEERFRREHIVMRACSAVEYAPVARLVAADVEELWIASEFVPVNRDGVWPSPAELGTALGALHRATADAARAYPGELGSWRSLPTDQTVVEQLEGLGIETGVAEDFIQSLFGLIALPGEPLVYSHGDIVAPNLRKTRRKVLLVDFEYAESASYSRDLAAIALAFPTASRPIEISPSSLQRALRAYEVEWRGRVIPSVQNLSSSAAWWLLLILGTHLPGLASSDRLWGEISVRGRVLARLRLFSRIDTSLDVGKTAAYIGARLAGIWHMDLYEPLGGLL